MKPKILICVLSGGERDAWINPTLFTTLLSIANARFPAMVNVTDIKPVERARNICAKLAIDQKAEWLFMVDNDTGLHPNFLEVLSLAREEHDIIALPCWGLTEGILTPVIGVSEEMLSAQPVNGFQEAEVAGTGAIFIRRRVLEAVPMPHFSMRLSADGLDYLMGEDFDFCHRAREHGFRVWTNVNYICEHYHQWEIGGLAKQMGAGLPMARMHMGMRAQVGGPDAGK